MEDVRIYDFEFNLLYVEHDILSCNWSFYENEIGNFEMHFHPESELTKIAFENRFLVAVQGDKQAIITGRQLGRDATLYGRSCNWILTRFCVGEIFDSDALFDAGGILSKDAKAVCSYLVEHWMADVQNIIVLSKTDDGFDDVFLKEQQLTTVFHLVQDCMKQAQGGHKVHFNVAEKRWELCLTKGQELPIVLSEDNLNVYESEYTSDLQELFFGGYFEKTITDKGEWDVFRNDPWLENGLRSNYATGYKVRLDKESTGYSEVKKFGYTFCDGDYIVCTSKDGQWEKASEMKSFIEKIVPELSGIYGWCTVLDGTDETEAVKNLAQCKEEKKSAAKTNGVLFGKDYQLGDRVFQRFSKGSYEVPILKKITGVNLWYEINEVGEQPIFEEEFN